MTGRVRACSGVIGRAVRGVAFTLDASAKTRRTALGLFALLAYLLVGQAIDPGFTDYWWYQLLQTGATLAVVLTLETVFVREGGLAWQTHAIVLATTYADVGGTTNGLYDIFDPYDKIVHFWSGAAFAAGVYEVFRLLERRGVIALTPARRVAAPVAVSFSIAGIAWEMYEQLSDVVFNSGRVQGRWDTIHDLVFDAGGAMAAVAVLRAREAVRGRAPRRSTA